MASIEPVTGIGNLEQLRTLIREYAAWLNLDACFGSIECELASLPGEYGPPSGVFLLAEQGGLTAGCVGLRKIGQGVGEIKRLFVRPAFRGQGIGKALVLGIISRARSLGYHTIRLDTVRNKMPEAVALYHSLGFVDIAPYNEHPAECTVWMQLDLLSPDADRA